MSGRIDVHAHSMGPAYRGAIQAIGGIIRTPDWSPDRALKHMDRHGVRAGILSLSTPGCHLGVYAEEAAGAGISAGEKSALHKRENAKACELATRVNDEAAGFIKQWPGRFGAFGTLPLPDIDGACKEVAHALDDLKLEGIGLLSSYRGKYLGHPDFDPVLAELDKRKAVVLVHPNNPEGVEIVRRGFSPGIGNFLAEFLFDTTRAALNLLFTDALHRYPNIKWILCHSGGTVPFIAWRISDIACRQMTNAPWDTQYPSAYMTRHGAKLSQEQVLKDFGRFYYETALSAGRQPLATTREIAAPDHILYGSDWPYCPDDMTEDMIAGTKDSGFFDEKQLAAIDHGNAGKLFPRFA